jgi:hypothetical protein
VFIGGAGEQVILVLNRLCVCVWFISLLSRFPLSHTLIPLPHLALPITPLSLTPNFPSQRSKVDDYEVDSRKALSRARSGKHPPPAQVSGGGETWKNTSGLPFLAPCCTVSSLSLCKVVGEFSYTHTRTHAHTHTHTHTHRSNGKIPQEEDPGICRDRMSEQQCIQRKQEGKCESDKVSQRSTGHGHQVSLSLSPSTLPLSLAYTHAHVFSLLLLLLTTLFVSVSQENMVVGAWGPGRCRKTCGACKVCAEGDTDCFDENRRKVRRNGCRVGSLLGGGKGWE